MAQKITTTTITFTIKTITTTTDLQNNDNAYIPDTYVGATK